MLRNPKQTNGLEEGCEWGYEVKDQRFRDVMLYVCLLTYSW